MILCCKFSVFRVHYGYINFKIKVENFTFSNMENNYDNMCGLWQTLQQKGERKKMLPGMSMSLAFALIIFFFFFFAILKSNVSSFSKACMCVVWNESDFARMSLDDFISSMHWAMPTIAAYVWINNINVNVQYFFYFISNLSCMQSVDEIWNFYSIATTMPS